MGKRGQSHVVHSGPRASSEERIRQDRSAFRPVLRAGQGRSLGNGDRPKERR